MRNRADKPFTAPTPEQVRRHLDRCAPRPPARWLAWTPLLVLVAALTVALGLGGGPWMLLAWLLIIALFVAIAVRQQRNQNLERSVNDLHELTMLRRFPQALRAAWRLLPRLARHPPLYGRTVSLLGVNLGALKAYEACLVVYDELLENLPAAHPWAVQLQIQRTIAQLDSDHLTDAHEGLRRLRGLVGDVADATTRAALRLANLMQQVRTFHWADAAAESDGLIEALRPLGIDAGYGHALAALAYHHVAAGNVAASAAQHFAAPQQQATLWWSRATTLLPPAALVDRFPELHVLAPELAPGTESQVSP